MLVSTTRNLGRHSSYELDMHILEYASRPAFWLIGTSILAWWIAMMIIANSGRSKNEQDKDPEPAKDKNTVPPSFFTRWLVPHITSHLQKALVLLACLALGYLEILEGYWIAVTAWRWSLKFYQLWPAWAGNPFWIHAVHTLSAVVLMSCITAIMSVAGVIFLFHISFIREISLISPTEHRRLATLKSADDTGGEERVISTEQGHV